MQENIISLLTKQPVEPLTAAKHTLPDAVRESIGLLLPPFVHAMHHSTMTIATAQFDEQTFANVWNEGRTMTVEQILAAKEPMTLPAQLSKGFSIANQAKLSPKFPDGLTKREVEVLRLVAQGMTDAQIASQLIISRRTVNWHLTSIYSKIQVSSRSAATRYSIEKNLFTYFNRRVMLFLYVD